MTGRPDAPLPPAWTDRAAWGTAPSLRAWQQAAMDTYQSRQPRDFLAVATPGAGKTTFALTVAADLLSRRVVDRITVVAPTEHLKTQWAEAAARAGIPIDPAYSAGKGKTSDDYVGIAVTYAGLLRGMDRDVVAERTDDLLRAMDLTADAGTQVQDYSAGMTKKIALAGALIHAPSLLVLDEPFESVDPVSAANIRDILESFAASGGTVIVSSHSMDLVQRMCDHVAVVSAGHVLAAGTVDEVRGGMSLEDRFVDLVGGRHRAEEPEWLRRS